jgi:hypothetical protein
MYSGSDADSTQADMHGPIVHNQSIKGEQSEKTLPLLDAGLMNANLLLPKFYACILTTQAVSKGCTLESLYD